MVSQKMIDDFFDLMRQLKQIDLNTHDTLLMSELNVLHCLLRHGETTLLTVSQLADKLKLPLASVSRTLSQLDKQGYICRYKDEEDRRTSRIQVTRLGRQAYNNAMQNDNQTLRQLLSQLDQDQLTQFIQTGEIISSTWEREMSKKQ